MKKLLSFITLAFMVVMMGSISASALSFKFGENITVTDEMLDDLYVAGGNVTVESDVFGDLYVAGGNVFINGAVHEDLVVAGGKVSIMNDVLGDLRVIGGQVSVFGNISGDLLVAGGQVDLGRDVSVGGSVVAGAGIVTIEGSVAENVQGGMGMLILNGSVGGDVLVTIEDTISISERASVGGNLKYSALLEASIPENVVAGEVIFNQFEKDEDLADLTNFFLIQKAFSYISALILALILVFVSPKMFETAAKLTKESILRAFGIGLLAVVVVIVAPIILMMTVVGIPIAVILLAMFLVVLYFAKIFTAAWLVSYVMNFKKKLPWWKLYGGIVVALLAYYLVGYIPYYVGTLIHAVLFLIGVGAMFLTERYYFSFLKAKKEL
ncbi:MAG: hypothetical protein V1679_01500 [Candidatus Peregrinibacteria bacterium]